MNTTGTANVFIGFYAGYSETGNNRLYIDNCYTGGSCTQPLIYGEFDSRIVNIDGMVTAASFVGSGSGLTGVVKTETDPKIGTLTSGKWCTSNGSTVSCTANAPLTVELDPRVGTLTKGGWCASNGEVVSCTESVPLLTEVDPKIGSNTINYIPRWNGTALVSGIISDNGSSANVAGTLTVSSLLSISDERLKNNIQPLNSSLTKMLSLRGVMFDWNAEMYPERGLPRSHQIGLIKDKRGQIRQVDVADEG